MLKETHITPASYIALQVSALTTAINHGTQTPNTHIYAFLKTKKKRGGGTQKWGQRTMLAGGCSTTDLNNSNNI